MGEAIKQYPHCDFRILHAPGRCEFCDRHADWQELRDTWNVNFTGRSDKGRTKCPAESIRPLGVIERWHGNVVSPKMEARLQEAEQIIEGFYKSMTEECRECQDEGELCVGHRDALNDWVNACRRFIGEK